MVEKSELPFSSMENEILKFCGEFGLPDFQANPLRPLVLSTLKTIFCNIGSTFACIKVLIVDAISVASVAACQKGS